MAIDHPDISELLLFESRELEEDRAKAVGQHIFVCAVCRAKLSEIDFFKENILEIHTAATHLNLQAAVDERKRKPRGGGFLLPTTSRSWMAATASVLIVALLFTFTDFTPAARAEALLSKAAKQEISAGGPRYLEIANGASQYLYTLGTPIKHDATTSSFPDAVIAGFRAAGWTSNNPLSAKSFLEWRSSLRHKHDTLHHVSGATEVTTSTFDGPIHKAMLRIRASDDRPVAGEFEFSAETHLSAVTIAEGKAPLVEEATAPAGRLLPRHAAAAVVNPVVHDPLDRVEARARLALHKLNQDGNILLAVQREPDTIKVWGAVPNEAIGTHLTDALAGLTSVKVAISAWSEQGNKDLPWRPYLGDTTPLAHEELQALYPNDLSGRQNLLNEVDRLTRRIVAEARARDGFVALAARMEASDDAAQLHEAITDVQAEMANDVGKLRSRVQPFTGVLGSQIRPLSYADAVQLYTLVHEVLFLGRNQDEMTLEDAIERMRSLLTAG